MLRRLSGSQTLCLLCSSLAWQQHHDGSGPAGAPAAGPAASLGLAASASVGFGAGVGGGRSADQIAALAALGIGRAGAAAPKIIYASRTHTQLSQVIQELKRSGYEPRIAVLGSREQLCVHREASPCLPRRACVSPRRSLIDLSALVCARRVSLTQVSKLRSTMQTHACRTMAKARGCV